jgi:hypothetical protein
MPVRLICCLLVVSAAFLAPVHAEADCANTISKLMSRDTEKLITRYQRIAKRVEKQHKSKLPPEGCRVARVLEPRLAGQIAALKESGCAKDPNVGPMLVDIVRGHEDDLAGLRKARAACR